MDRVDVAEWLLRQVTDPVRAAEIIGDQLEAAPTTGAFRFWFVVCELLFVFSWRRAVSVAFSACGGILFGLASLFVSDLRPFGTPNALQENTIGQILVYACGISMLLWTGTIFSFLRFGWRDPLTRIGTITSVFWSGSICFLWYRSSATALLLAWLGYFAFFMRTRERRASLAILVALVIAGC